MSDAAEQTATGARPLSRGRRVVLVGAVVVLLLFGGWLHLRDLVMSRACETVDVMVADGKGGYRKPTYEEAVAVGVSEHCARAFYSEGG